MIALRRLLPAVLCLSVLAVAPGASAARRVLDGVPLADPTPDGLSGLRARVLFSTNLLGDFEPCSCPETPLGGIAQLAGTVAGARGAEGEPPVFWLDAGDRLFRHDGAMHSVAEAERKAKAILHVDAGNVAGLDAAGVGRLELGAGLAYLQLLQKRSRAPLVSANLIDERGMLLFQPTVLIDRGGLKLGVTAVVSGDSAGDGFSALDPKQAAKAAVARLRADGADYVVLLSNLGPKEDRALARVVKPDAILGSGSRELLEQGTKIGSVTVERAGSKGRYLGEVRFYDKGPGRGPYSLGTLVPVDSEQAGHPDVVRLVERLLVRLADPALGVPALSPGQAERLLRGEEP